ncbi:Gfo/Idh/MocA family oxidoreductase [Chitinophaga horti]|uniref:Gfo/Idh/MocA family oxidoreductase n=1 Tax=Chitinophaga horti TaxID=2920382 RepID=A0ABY6IUV0_9BACT|nr:Gfo/Idh/MocA family oxidoreductase [Chitinophaga horti]UYQ91140.1 Gfo/Idh/MocA family oxidoreductase [Chitinophaga horti]
MIQKLRVFLLLLFISTTTFAQQPLRLAVAGLSHGHVGWVFNRKEKKDMELVGIYEPNTQLADKIARQYKLDKKLFYTDLDAMLKATKPQAVSAFGAISEHLAVVKACAPLKVHVMVEKPLATTFKDAQQIAALAQQHGIHVITNFETSWYAGNQYVKQLLDSGRLGPIKKVMVNDGHQGPQEIGCSREFLEILTDPAKNGAGALYDFGCYGANLMTWLLKGKRPLSVTAVTHQNKPNIYPKVDDEATIVLQYASSQCVIQASWNWPFSRKDMEVYGATGYAVAVNDLQVRERLKGQQEKTITLEARPAPFTDPFSVLAQVVSGQLKLEEYDQYGLKVNLLVVEILEAAKTAARTGKTVVLRP